MFFSPFLNVTVFIFEAVTEVISLKSDRSRLWRQKLQLGPPGAGLMSCPLGYAAHTSGVCPVFPACSRIWFDSHSNECCSSCFLLDHLLY